MPIRYRGTFSGHAELQNTLKALPALFQTEVLEFADGRLAAWAVPRFKAEAPTDNYISANNREYGTLRDNVIQRKAKKRSVPYKRGLTRIVGSGKGYWASFGELGTAYRYTKKGAYRGRVKKGTNSYFADTLKKIGAGEARDVYLREARRGFVCDS